MKKLFAVSALAIALLFVGSSCEKLDEFTTIDINTELAEKVEVDIQDTGDIAVQKTMTFAASNNEELERYMDKLKTIDITTIKYKVSNYQGEDDGAFKGYLKFADLPYTLELPRTEVLYAAENQIVTTIQATEEQLAHISNLFLDGQDVDVDFEGTAYNAPMKFSLELIIEIKAQAEIQE